MRVTSVALLTLMFVCGNAGAMRAEQAKTCQASCRDQQKACAANYQPKTCKAEYDRCMKSCKDK